jgi:hypothetical protein
MMIGLRRMMICLRQNEGEFPQAEISDFNKKEEKLLKILKKLFSKSFFSGARGDAPKCASNRRRPCRLFGRSETSLYGEVFTPSPSRPLKAQLQLWGE